MTGKSPVVQVLTELKGHNLLEDRSFSTIAEGLATQATVNAESVLSAAAIVRKHKDILNEDSRNGRMQKTSINTG